MPKPSAASTNHWAFQPVVRPSIPVVRNKSWPRTPIDFFILAKREEAGLTASPPADKATLLRRVTFDLHGLPPSLIQVSSAEMVYPDAVWYTYVDQHDIDEIVDSHLKQGKPVERLKLAPNVGR